MSKDIKERPILFSGAMVNAILAGTKTQTRRIAKEFPPNVINSQILVQHPHQKGCRFGNVGDHLWVREAFSVGYSYPNGRESGEKKYYYSYRATDELRSLEGVFIQTVPGADVSKFQTMADLRAWKPSIHMPREASRITLEITKLRVERLNALSQEDAKAEGVLPEPGDCQYQWCVERGGTAPTWGSTYCVCCQTPRIKFAHLWDNINGKKDPWKSNPWVWVIEFKVIK